MPSAAAAANVKTVMEAGMRVRLVTEQDMKPARSAMETAWIMALAAGLAEGAAASCVHIVTESEPLGTVRNAAAHLSARPVEEQARGDNKEPLWFVTERLFLF